MGGQSYHIDDLSGHIVICNCNEKVGRIVEELHAGSADDPLVIVLVVQDESLWEKNPAWHPKESSMGCFYWVNGCPSDEAVLKAAGIRFARAAVILADPNHGDLADAPSTLIAMAIEKQNPQVHTIIELIAAGNRQHLEAVDVNEVICMGEISEKLIVQSCITPGIKSIFEDILTFREGTSQIYVPSLPDMLSGMTFREICRKIILSEVRFVCIGFVRNEVVRGACENEWCLALSPAYMAGERKCVRSRTVINPKAGDDPGKDTVLTEDDQLVLIGHERPDFSKLL